MIFASQIFLGFYSNRSFFHWIVRVITNSDYTDSFLLYENNGKEWIIYSKKKMLTTELFTKEVKKKWFSYVLYKPSNLFNERFNASFKEESDCRLDSKITCSKFIVRILKKCHFPLSDKLDLKTVNFNILKEFADSSLFLKAKGK